MRLFSTGCLLGITVCLCASAPVVAQDPGAGVVLDSIVVDTTIGASDSLIVTLRRHELYRLAVWTTARSFVIRHTDRAGSITPIEVPSPASNRRLYEYAPSRGGDYVLTVSDRARVAVYAATREARVTTASRYRFDIGLVFGEYRPTADLMQLPNDNLRHEHAFTLGLRFTTRQRSGRLGAEADVYRVRSDVSGNADSLTPLFGTPRPLGPTTSYFADVRFLYFVTPPDGHIEVALGAGIGVVWRDADDLLQTRIGATSLAGSLAARLRVPLVPALGAILTIEDHIYGLGDDGDPDTSSPTQQDVILGAGATFRF